MVTGDVAMVNGVLTGVILKQWITGSLVDDGLDFWITGSLCLAGTVFVPDTVTFLVFLRN